MHAMVYHVRKFLEAYKTVKMFTCQGVEKNNDMPRRIVLRKSNEWDRAGDVLKLELRQWKLRNQHYNIQQANYPVLGGEARRGKGKKRKTVFDSNALF